MAKLQSPPGARPALGYHGNGAGATRGGDQSAILIGLVPLLPPLEKNTADRADLPMI